METLGKLLKHVYYGHEFGWKEFLEAFTAFIRSIDGQLLIVRHIYRHSEPLVKNLIDSTLVLSEISYDFCKGMMKSFRKESASDPVKIHKEWIGISESIL